MKPEANKTNKQNIEDIYPLSPMQQGMLFESLYAPDSGVYFQQVVCTFEGNLDLSAFKQAWQQVVARHSVFRTAFLWERVSQPTQIVYRQVDVAIETFDWRGLSAQEQQQQLQVFLDAQQQQGFSFSEAPLMRLHLIQCKENTYQFVWSHHHLLLDGWSLSLVFKDLLNFYQAISQGKTLTYQPALNYRNYIAWLQKQDRKLAEDYWKEKLQGFSASTPLMVDKPLSKRENNSPNYKEQEIELSRESTSYANTFVREHQLTLANLAQATWALLLSRYSQENDVVFGATVSGRPPAIAGVESMVGLFINTLPLRVKFSEQTELLSLLKDVQVQLVDSEQFSYSSLVEIQGFSDVPRGTSLFDSIVIFENYLVDSSVLEDKGDFSLSNVQVIEKTNYPLTLFVEPGEQLLVRLSYDGNRFDDRAISRMLGHFVTLFEAIVANPQMPISQLPILTAVEQNQILIEWNNTKTNYPTNNCIHQLFEEQVEKTPDAIAVVFENQQLTYRELNDRSNQLAHHLRSLGVGADVLVGICVERSLEMLVGLLGILKAGGAYVPLDPEYPTERIAFMLSNSQVSVLLTQEKLITQLPKIDLHLISLDADWEIIAQQNQNNIVNQVSTQNLAYIIYTSGSTGQPKGVQISHFSLTNFLYSMKQEVGINAKDILLAVTTICFDIAGLEFYLPLIVGAQVVLLPREQSADGTKLSEKLLQSGVTIMQATPATWRLLLGSGWQGNQQLKILCGGEALTHDLAVALLERSQCLWNVYGPTETTIWSTISRVEADASIAGVQDSLESIGRPIANTQIYILDRYLQPVPIGVPGELHIGGAGLAKGYLNRPELTNEKFIANPFENSKLLYKTGDLARYLPNGNIEYLGRIDNQVKIRGFRIELGEIEAILSQYPQVQTAVVIAREDIPGDKRLVAYITTEIEATPTNNELREYLKSKLPEYMVPFTFVILEAFPLTPNGKIDRRALPAPDFHTQQQDKYQAPRTPVEEILITAWKQILKLNQVGIHDNFFELGGHSLLATQLISRIRNHLQVELPLRSLFGAPTIAELAPAIQQLQQQNLQLSAPPIVKRDNNNDLPLSFAQTRLWFIDQFESNSGLYNIPFAIRLEGTLCVATLEQSFQEIVVRHEALRTNFITLDGQPNQIIQSQINWKLSVVNFKDLSTNQQETAALELLQQKAIEPFDLANDCLLQATLVALSETEHILLICMHHIVSDGWSIGVLLAELAALYNAYTQDLPSPLDPLPIQYADFAIWQRQWLQGEVLQTQLSYWQNQLADAPALLSLPTDRPRPAVQTFVGGHQQFALSAELTQKLNQLSQEQGVTLFMTLFAAFNTLLYRYSGQTDIVVGTPIANRNHQEIEGLIGFFINTLVIRTDLSNNQSFTKLLNQVREVSLGAYTHQDLPFEMLVEALQPERNLSYSPLFQVMFALQNAPVSLVDLDGLKLTTVEVENPIAKFDLGLGMESTPNGLVGWWEYNTDLFNGNTIERMTGHFVTLLEAIVANPQTPISRLPILTATEQQQLIEWNNTQTNEAIDKCLHQLFEEQVEKTPDAVAVVFENQQLTYRELNNRANQLAHYLRYEGVGADVPVGICVERSLELVVGVLGILKAGGAYVPLDPEYPVERLRFMLEDSKVRVLLTQQKFVETLYTTSLPQHPAHLVCLDRDWQVISQHSPANLICNVQPENLAYIIYTSGSTGQPKGVAMNHLPLVNLILWQQQQTTISPGAKTLQFAPISFDVSCQEMFSTWCNGGTLLLITEQIRREPVALLNLLQEQAIERVFLPFVGLQQLAEVAIDRTSAVQLREIITAGEQLQMTPAITQWLNQLSNCTLHNHYGPSESHVVTSYTLNQTGESWPLLPPIGRPIANSQIYILDPQLQPTPIGVPGELHIGGVSLARGYLNRPELTSEKFIANPFDNEPNSRLYKTGDLARYLPDGNIEYLGRIDNQVKIRGFRIELGEIEAVLSQHPQVKTAVAIVREDTPGDKRLVAYITPQPSATPTSSELRQYMKAKLPEYMVPSAFVILETLPLTPSGKVDRRALRAPDFQTQQDKYQAPRTPIEEILTQEWGQILKLNQVGIHDNFFELGGHSLLATQLMSRIRSHFQVELPLRSLFAAPTVAELAPIIQQLQQQNLQLSSPPIVKRDNNSDLPLSFAETRLWFIDQLEPNSALYNIPAALRLEGTLCVTALEQSFREIVQRHEALRTNFIAVDGQPTQIIHEEANWKLSIIDGRDLSNQESESALAELLQQQANAPFDLANDCLLRATLIALSDTEHILSLCMHHIVSDGWSIGVFVAELVALYDAYAQGQPSPLSPLPIQYTDFAIWQRNWLQGEVLQTQLSYWQDQLADVPPLLALPTDRPRPAVQTYQGAHQEFALSAELTQKLTILSQEQGTTLFMTLLAAFDTLLYRYSGQTDIVVGSPIANRNKSEIEGLIGFFVNTLVLRTDLSNNPSFATLLDRVREVSLAAYTHQDLPFEMLVEALQPERDLGHTPLFQVMFILQNAPLPELELGGLTLTPVEIENAIAKFDLNLSMQSTPTGLVGMWEYNTDLFDGSTILRMTGHFVTLLEGIVANPQTQISQLPMLTSSEQHQLLVEWNDTQTNYPVEQCLHQLFEQQVEKTPLAIAVVFEAQQLTYRELNDRANQLANYLRSLGVGADVTVGICLERSLEMVVGVLGILKAGGAYLPLDPGYPSERLHFMLQDSQVSVLLTQQQFVETLYTTSLPTHLAHLVCLDTNWAVISQHSPVNPTSEVQPENIAYLIYTSGSTGQPKGIAMNHRPLVNLIHWQVENSTISPGSKTLQFAPISFDVSCQEMFSTWSDGGTLLLISEQIRREPLALLGLLEELAVERLFLPFVGLQQLAEVAIDRTSTMQLREIITAGEQLQMTPAITQWLSRLSNCTLHNHYGPSESHAVTSFTLSNSQESWSLLPPIGRPIANSQIYILDPQLQPVPIGVPGELHIGGVSLARGYLNRPELTNEKFIANPFDNEPNSRLYKTGDLARYLPDGNIEYLGRIDNQVKIRGFRIELGEIEGILGQHPQVQAAAAIVREDTPGDKRLVAYITAQPSATPSSNELRQYLKAKLPEYMVPSAFVLLETLPLTPSGKLDRRALPTPDYQGIQKDKYQAPRTPIEEILTHLWGQILKLNQVGIHDNFFELGGHSLLATQLMSRIRSHFQVELPLRSLFAAPTVAELAPIIGQLQQQNLQLSSPPIVKRDNNSDRPLSYAQTRLWFIDQFQPNSALYNIPAALRLVGSLDVAALEQSFREIVQRHEALRTNFLTVDGQPRQIIHSETSWTLSIVDGRNLSTIEQLLQQQANAPFDLANDCLLRTTLVTLSETEHILLICMHHIVSDGWSIGVFVEELTALYNAYAQGQPSPLSPLPIQYTDFAIWQRNWLQGEVLQSQLSYWLASLADAPAILSLPTDRPRPAVQTFVGAHQQFTLSAELTEKLNQLSQEQGVTLFMTLLAAFDTLLYRYSGQTDIVVGSPIANRNKSEIEGLIGFFINTLVLRTDLSNNPCFAQLLDRVREVSLGAYAHQDLPFEMLVEALQPERDLSHTPLFQVMFVLQNAPVSDLELGGLTLSLLELENAIAKFDLTLAMESTPDGLVGLWEYNTDLFDGSTILRMTGHFVTLLEGIVANPETPISQIPMLTTVEQHQLLTEWNNTQTDYPATLCIHQLFEQQVEKTPDAVAVVFDFQQLTYRELNERSNQLAHYLRSLGVGADVLVGICVERSIEMVVGILGIIKAGGAYVPIDPTYPQDRLSFMLSDTGVKVLLTQENLVNSLPKHEALVVCLDSDWQSINQASQENLHSRVSAENLAYVIYTSGSTGTPKGVIVTHQAVNRLVKNTNYIQITADDRIAQASNIAFDAATFEIWGALLNGAKLVIITKSVLLSPPELAISLRENQIGILFLTTALFNQLAREVPQAFSGLRYLLFGGEAVDPFWVREVLDKGRPQQLLHVYGPTENTTFSSWYLVEDLPLSATTVAIGRPIANTQIYILDQYLQPVPVCVPGELHIGGAGLARGYLNRPELTNEKFIANPLSNDPNSRLYKTGDLVRYLPDGNIEYLGRIDNQVKIRGFRIELGEIEAILSQHPQVQTAVAIVREDTPGDKRLVAYIVAPAEATPATNELRQYLKAKLPEYMVPSAFVILEALPITPNGKVDRRALPIPESRSGIEVKLVAPRTPEEKTLTQIWTQVLGVEQIGIHDNFFELGGDSILSIQIITKARQAGLELSVKQLFTNQTIAQLAAVAKTSKAIQIAQEPVTGAVKLTPIQQWFFEQNLTNPHHFNQSWIFTVPADFQVEHLEPIWEQLLIHHDALRLRFTQTESGWEQTHATPNQRITLSSFDLSTVSESEWQNAIESTANTLQASLNLEENLVQVAHFKGGENKEGRLLIVIHHLVVDGVSWRILLEDFQTAYQQLSQNQAIQLLPKTTSFKAWVQQLSTYAQYAYGTLTRTDVLSSQTAYWLRESYTSVSPIPVDYHQGENTIASAQNVSVSLSEVETQALLQDVPKAYKTQINDVLLTALVLVLSKWTNSNSVLFNLEGHGREDIIEGVDLSRTVGWFTTIFPVVMQLENTNKLNLGEVLKSVKEQLRSIPNKGIGYGLLRYLSENQDIQSQIKNLKEAEISFNYLGQFSQLFNQSSLLQLANESSGNYSCLQNLRSHLLDINAIITNERLHIDWTYSSNLHYSSTIEKIATDFVTTLRELIAHCLSPENGGYTPSDFPLIKLTQPELDRVLAKLPLTNWQNVEDIYPLSPMQQGMLFESLYAPDSGVYVEVLSCTLTGDLNVSAFEQAWQQVVVHHSIFRTAFLWESLHQPLQVVFREVNINVATYDWRDLSAVEQQQQLETFLDSEHQQGFSFSQAPLMRLYLIQKSENSYQFVWSFHHILLDGWSLPLVLKDLWDFYEVILTDKSFDRQPSLNYRHYIAWLQQQNVAQSQAFWQQKLANFSAPTPLMVDKPLSHRENGLASYGEQHIELSLSATAYANSFVRKHQLTLSNLVQATWALLLSRYSQEIDVVFGATVSGRPPVINGVESMVGLFINTLPMRVRFTENTQLLGLLKDLQAQLVESEQFAYSSLVEIQGFSDVPRGTSLFDSIVVFENYPTDSTLLEDNSNFSFSNFRAIEQTNYPLTIVVGPGEQLFLKVSYDANRFDDSAISRMLGHFVTLLEAIVTNPQMPISQLPMLTVAEQHQLLTEWNNTQTDYPTDKCLHQLFEEQVEKTPNALAVVFENQQLTYRELNDRANQLANYLRSLGVGADTPVGICVERSTEMVIGLLGILKAGGAYVPLDPEYPTDRLRFMLSDSSVTVLLTQQKLLNSLPEHNAQIFCLDTDWQAISHFNQDNLPLNVAPENLAYIIYTSGSTGQPKGAMNTHKGICNRLLWMQEAYQLTTDDVVLQKTPFSFDVSVWEFFWTLLNGSRLVVAKPGGHRDSEYLVNLISQQQVTTLHFVPSMLQVFLESPNLALCESLRRVICSGEALSVDLQTKFFERLGCELHNLYGPTEAAIDVTYWECDRHSSLDTVPIGKPIANTQIYILDRYLQPVPVGVPGELHIGGVGLATGYLNRKELTTEKFIDSPFDNAKLYKTGDLARYLPDGNIEYLGRIDNQVKIRGFRIELGEIEAVLSQYPEVQAAVVIAREDNPGDKRLVAYITTETGATPTIDELRQYLKAKLPEYMVPSAFVLLETLPLTPNGKIDRRSLPAPDFHTQQQNKYVAPRTPLEEILITAWRQILNLNQVGIHDNFFEIGGHSLLATQLISRIRSHLQIELPLRSLFSAPTVAQLAPIIQQLQQQDLQLSAPPLLARDNNNDLPLSFAQTRLWFIDQFEPNSALYNISAALRLEGTLCVTALEQSLTEIVQRHEALRTNFITVDGQANQIIHEQTNWKLSVVDFKDLSESESKIAAVELVQQQAIQPFNLATDSLLRATLVTLSDTEHILLICMHHIVSDGWSIGVFVEELTALYNAYAQGQPSPLSPLPIQYSDFAIWQRNWLQGEVLQTQLSYWQNQLIGAPAILSLPTDRPRKAKQTFVGAHQEFALSAQLSEKLNQLSQEQGVTLFMTLLAAFNTLLYRYSGQTDIVVGSPIANRNKSEIEGLIGFFVNTLVLRTDLSNNPSFAALLDRVREVSLGAYTHQDLPFEMLVEALQPERDLSYTPLFQVMFVLQNAPLSSVELDGLKLTPVEMENPIAKFDLTLSMESTPDGLMGWWEYNTDLFDGSTIERMIGHFVTLLEGIVANPLSAISQLPMLTSSEQQQLLVQWNNTQTDYPVDKCLHQLFEEQVLKTPQSVAVVFENQRLTYSELNDRSNQLAHYLRSLGVGADVLVGICVERSLEMIVGILGILKAGGAYVPLDPTYPQDRLSFILEDAQISVLLSQQHLVEKLPQHQARVIYLDSEWETIAQHSQSNPQDTATSSNLAYIIYTSGSTGQPKGVLVNHSNVVRLFAATDDWYRFNAQDVWTLFHSYAFDFSVWEIWGALLYGGKLVVVPYLVTREPESFYKLLVEEKVTVLNQTPSAFRQLIPAALSAETEGDLRLRLVIFGGEALEPKHLQPWFERYGDQMPQLVNMYGITETTVHVTYRPLSMADVNGTASVIGRPIRDLQVYVLDQHLQPVPVGVPGEMYVGGAGVTRGYLNRDDLTTERFIRDRFSHNPNARLYKTGDLARYLPNGDLEYLGRIDQQVKIRGFRIELGEIEALLASHPAVRESVVVVREDVPGDKRLVAYVIPKSEQSPSTAELRRFLKAFLPEYMVPSAFVQLDALPLTANGKLDRSALKAPDSARPELENAFVAPNTSEEKILAAVWAKVLGVEQVGINDNFFALGGDSIRSIQVLALAKAQGLNFSLVQLFQHQTIHDLLAELKTQDWESEKLELTQPFSLISEVDKQQLPDGVEDAYPLAKLQMGMLFHSEYSKDSGIYHDIFSFYLKTGFDVQCLKAALQDLVDRHAVLRTSFELSKYSIPLQLVHQQVEVPLQVEDWCHLNDSEQEEALTAWFEAEKKQRFDWTNPPLLRLFVHRRTPETFNLTLSFHHAILDGWSVASMMSELLKRYLSHLGEPVELNSTPISIEFRDFVAQEAQTLASLECQRYWSEKLRDRTFTPLPRWSSVSTNTNVQDVGVTDVTLSPEICASLKGLAQSAEVPLKSVLLAAHLRVLNLLGGNEDVLTGLVSNGRTEQSDGDRVLGLFLNTLPFRLQLTGGTWIDLVQQVFAAERELLPHRRYPLAEIQRSLGGEPLFETAFNFTHFHVYEQVIGLDNLEVLGGKFFEETNFAVVAQFSVNPGSSEVFLRINYDPLKLCQEQANRIGEYYFNALAAMVNQPQERYELHSLLSQEEAQQILVEWNNTQTPLGELGRGIGDREENHSLTPNPYHLTPSFCLHQLFEEQVLKTPDAVAVVFEGQQLTYRELNDRSNQLAHYLRSLGVGADVLVGICVERSREMIVGILGILKAGGAYIPLDPDYPTERLRFMLSDSQVSVLLTQQKFVQTLYTTSVPEQTSLPQHQAQIVCLDRDWETIAEYSNANPENTATPNNLAYIIYTSGSTGQPKGVLVNHSNVLRLFTATNDRYHFNEQDVWTLFHSYAFDFSVWEIWGALLYGGKLVVVPYLVTREPESFYKLLVEEKVTVLNQTPSAFRQLIQAEESLTTVGDLKLRLVIFGGEALEPKSLQPWFERHGDRQPQLVNMYGITETTVHVTYRPLTIADVNGTASVIGRPIPDLQVYVLDRHLQPVPVGVTGEMYVGGAGVTRGYLNRPDLTSEKFIANPFGDRGQVLGDRDSLGDRGQGLGDREKEFPQPPTPNTQPLLFPQPL
ncbi:non-ribosomal peptide synthase/polyketide synthase, partial [Floridanema aerugineum]